MADEEETHSHPVSREEFDRLASRLDELSKRPTTEPGDFAPASHDHPQYARVDEMQDIAQEEAQHVVQEEEKRSPPEEVFEVETPPEPEPEPEPEQRLPRSRRYGRGR